MPRLIVPDDLPQVPSIYNFAACRTRIEMVALMLDLFIMSLAGNGPVVKVRSLFENGTLRSELPSLPIQGLAIITVFPKKLADLRY